MAVPARSEGGGKVGLRPVTDGKVGRTAMQDTRKAPATTEDAKPWASLSWPNRITLFRLLLIAPFIVLILNQREWGDSARYGALAVFVIMAVSDFLDGMLARRLNRKTRFGAIPDPLADKALIISAVVLLSLPDSAVPAAPISNWIVVVNCPSTAVRVSRLAVICRVPVGFGGMVLPLLTVIGARPAFLLILPLTAW